MALSHRSWANDAVLNAVSGGSRVLRKGERGIHIERLQQVLTGLEFPTFDPKGAYSDGTATALSQFKEYYYFYFTLPGTDGSTVDKYCIDKIDDALRGRLQSLKQATPVAGSRLAAAVSSLPTVRRWLAAALAACNLGTQMLNKQLQLNLENDKHTNVLSAFYLHFRLSLIKDKFLIPALLPYNIDDKLIRHATPVDILNIKSVLSRIERATHLPTARLFREAPDHGTDIASTPVGSPILLHPPFAGRQIESICWIIIHESVHFVLGTPSHHSAGSNPYAHLALYTSLNAGQCKTNPDCFTHFARQMEKGTPQLTPW